MRHITVRLSNGMVVMDVDEGLFRKFQADCKKSVCQAVKTAEGTNDKILPQDGMQNIEMIMFCKCFNFGKKWSNSLWVSSLCSVTID
jgi:hypothetical protein